MEILTAKQKKNLSRISTVRVHPPVDIHVICQRMSDQGAIFHLRQISVFNGITIISSPGMTENQIYQVWRAESQARREKRQNSFFAEKRRRDQAMQKERKEHNKEKILKLLESEKIQVPFFKRLSFNRVVRILSKSGYSKAILDYAIAFAVLMQQALKEGKQFEDIAPEVQYYPDYIGITVEQASIAIGLLSKYWRHGKELDHWLLIK